MFDGVYPPPRTRAKLSTKPQKGKAKGNATTFEPVIPPVFPSPRPVDQAQPVNMPVHKFDPGDDDQIMKELPSQSVQKQSSQKGTSNAKKRTERKNDLQNQVDEYQVIAKIMNAPVTISVGEALTSKELAKQMQDVLKPKAVPTNVNLLASSFYTRSRGTLIRLKVECEGKLLAAIIDTGSQLNIASGNVYRQVINRPLDLSRATNVHDANGGEGQLRGLVENVPLVCGGVTTYANLFIGEQVPFDMLLGRPWQRGNYVTIDERHDGTYLLFKDRNLQVRYEVMVSPETEDVGWDFDPNHWAQEHASAVMPVPPKMYKTTHNTIQNVIKVPPVCAMVDREQNASSSNQDQDIKGKGCEIVNTAAGPQHSPEMAIGSQVESASHEMPTNTQNGTTSSQTNLNQSTSLSEKEIEMLTEAFEFLKTSFFCQPSGSSQQPVMIDDPDYAQVELISEEDNYAPYLRPNHVEELRNSVFEPLETQSSISQDVEAMYDTDIRVESQSSTVIRSNLPTGLNPSHPSDPQLEIQVRKPSSVRREALLMENLPDSREETQWALPRTLAPELAPVNAQNRTEPFQENMSQPSVGLIGEILGESNYPPSAPIMSQETHQSQELTLPPATESSSSRELGDLMNLATGNPKEPDKPISTQKSSEVVTVPEDLPSFQEENISASTLILAPVLAPKDAENRTGKCQKMGNQVPLDIEYRDSSTYLDMPMMSSKTQKDDSSSPTATQP